MRLNCNEIMAATDDITECMFTVGSVVSCITCFDVEIEGEVIAFDYTKRLLVIKSESTAIVNTNDINCVNLDYVKNVSIKKEVKREDVVNNQLPQINTLKVEQRARNAIEERRRLAEAFNSGISPDGVKLYLSLSKTIESVTFDSDNIIVSNSVKISPPYKVDNCITIKQRSATNNNLNLQMEHSLGYSKRLVEKYWTDKQKQTVSQKNQNAVSSTDKLPVNNKG